MHAKFLKNCKEQDCDITSYNTDFDTFQQENPDIKYDIIIFIYSFQFMNKKNIIKRIMKSLNSDGYIIINYTNLNPRGWHDDSYNKNSEKFDQKEWSKWKELLLEYLDIIQKNKYLIKEIIDVSKLPFLELYPNNKIDIEIKNSAKVYLLQKK